MRLYFALIAIPDLGFLEAGILDPAVSVAAVKRKDDGQIIIVVFEELTQFPDGHSLFGRDESGMLVAPSVE